MDSKLLEGINAVKSVNGLKQYVVEVSSKLNEVQSLVGNIDLDKVTELKSIIEVLQSDINSIKSKMDVVTTVYEKLDDIHNALSSIPAFVKKLIGLKY